MASNNGDYKYVGTRPVRPDGVDKVTGRANFGADMAMAGMLIGKTLRSPHAHARIRSINTDKAKAVPGVKAVLTGADFPDITAEEAFAGEAPTNYRHMAQNVIAREKVLYDGHVVAAVAATSSAIAEQAVSLIDVDYEILPHVLDVDAAMAADAPLLHDDLMTGGVDPAPTTASNIAAKTEFKLGDLEAGFAAADEIVERSYTTQPVHQGYIEPHACLAKYNADGQSEVFCSSQGQFMVRDYCAKVLNMSVGQIRVTPAEIGGGFGGKTVVYLEPLAIQLSRRSGRPVKMVMSREEVFRGSGPTSGSSMTVKIGAKKDGTITAAYGEFKLLAGAFPGSPAGPACMTAFACYDLENVQAVGWDVVVNRPKVAAYRAPGAPISAFGVESAVDELAKRLNMDPLELRLKNAAKEGTRAAYGPKFRQIGNIETMDAIKQSEHFKTPLGPNQGRGVASGFWFNIGGESCATININEDGTATLVMGSPDIGGSRASLSMMAAETIGMDVAHIRPLVADTNAVGYTFLTGGSRVTFATGMAVVDAAKAVVDELRERAAKTWEIPAEAVTWEDGFARPSGANAGDFEPLSLADIAQQAGKTGGPIGGMATVNAGGAGPGFGTHLVDVEVDRETGHVTILRYTASQDAGKAIHPSYVEGQIQGGVVQGIGWALNEEYIYDEKGRLQNPGFLDYRIPVASDLPMIEPLIVEVPNPRHPYGVRGVGEVPIVPPMAAIANAIENATGIRMADLPMSPPRMLAAMDEVKAAAD